MICEDLIYASLESVIFGNATLEKQAELGCCILYAIRLRTFCICLRKDRKTRFKRAT